MVVDESGKPRKGVQIEFLPVPRDDEAWTSFRNEWTDTEGRFSVDRLAPGRYVIAVHHRYAPHESEPFARVYYPGAEAETAAASVQVDQRSRVFLDPLRLRSLSLRTIHIEVVWADGSRPKRSNVLFHNISYPHQAVIGDVAPQVDDGAGEFKVPDGFEYSVQAKVDCDAGQTIQARESTERSVKIQGSANPDRLTLSLPGTPCKLWSP
jgi:hypothetical protein